jgi:hypothetical protein
MRKRVCRLQFLLALTSSVILRSGSQIRDSPNLEGQVPVFISSGTGWPGYTPMHRVPFSSQGGPVIPQCTGFPFRRLLCFAGLRWSYSTPPPHGIGNCFGCCVLTRRYLATNLNIARSPASIFISLFFELQMANASHNFRILKKQYMNCSEGMKNFDELHPNLRT